MDIAEKYIDFSFIESIINKNGKKKILCFGGGTAAGILMDKLLYRYPVQYFLDNNHEVHGKKIRGIPSCSPESLGGMEKGTLYVLILSQHVKVIGEQLESFGLESQKDYYDIYEPFKPYFRIKRFESSMKQYHEFLARIPEDYFNDVTVKHGNKIGIVCVTTMANQTTWFEFTLYLLLKKLGYNVRLVVDCLRGFHDLTYFEGHGEVMREYCQQILDYMASRFSGIRYQFIGNEEAVELDEADEREAERLTEINLIWHHSIIPEWGDGSYEEHREKYSRIIRENMGILKRFFQHNHFDSINVLTALHRHRGIYMWEGIRHKMRVSSYDGNAYGTNYPVSHYYDINRILDENWLSEKERERVIKYSMELFEKRIHKTSANDSDSFQPESKEGNIKYYDVIMTLNVEWDAPALGLERIFDSYRDWMLETIDYIKTQTEATMLIREHPIIAKLVNYDNGNWEQVAKERIGDCDRIYFCRYDEKVNTYDLISHAKVVLPYSSTTGLEAVLLGIPVITHTKCFYDTLNCVWSSKDRDNYFALLETALDGGLSVQAGQKEVAALAFAFIMNHTNKDIFNEQSSEWYAFTMDELLQRENVKKILMVIGENVPLPYLNILEYMGI